MAKSDVDSLTFDADPETEGILQQMLEDDETITARALARKHPAIKHASSVTRSQVRSNLLARYQERQNQFREWQDRMPKRSCDQLTAQLAQKDRRIAELDRRVEVLCVSHLIMVRVVGELGGTSKLLKLYEGYRNVRSELERMGVLPRCSVRKMELKYEYQDEDSTT
jgi:hypothetical protein